MSTKRTSAPASGRAARLAIDIGGTFTDIAIIAADGTLLKTKVPSDLSTITAAVVKAVGNIAGDAMAWEHVLHATTVFTNALLENKLPPTALLTTRGFRDVLPFRRQKRENLYSLDWSPPPALVSRDRILEIGERIGARGEIVQPIDDAEIVAAAKRIADMGVQSVAISFLNAYANPAHERQVRDRLTVLLPAIPVSASSDMVPEIGEYERTSTTVAHAALKPIVSAYLSELSQSLRSAKLLGGRLFVMQSNGGLASEEQIHDLPAAAVESGPAAGALFAGELCRAQGIARAISFDMGGTTAKAALIEDGRPGETRELRIGGEMHAGEGFRDRGGYVVRGRTVDVVEVGAGGGSICRVDEAGALRVGPASAGAVPGPACYGRGGALPTVTDAQVVLGIYETGVASGGVALDAGLARNAIDKHVAQPLKCSVEEAAWLINEVATSNMMRAIAAVTSERGRDPADFALVAFGGGGPAHACAISREMGITRIVVPVTADCFSAVGLHYCAVRRDAQQPWLRALKTLDSAALTAAFVAMENDLKAGMQRDALAPPQLEWRADLRLAGQSSEIPIPVPHGDGEQPGDLRELLSGRFVADYTREYGHLPPKGEIEIVNLRVRAESRFASQGSGAASMTDTPRPGGKAGPSTARVYFGREQGWLDCPRLSMADLSEKETPGPVLVQIGQATAVIPRGGAVKRCGSDLLDIRLPPRAAQVKAAPGWDGRAALELFQNKMGTVVDRMAYTIARTAYSTMASDSHDFSVAICDAQGRVVNQGLGVLIHLGSVTSAMEAIAASDLGPLEPGDVILLNDPYNGGTHLPDLILVSPAFAGSELIGHTVAIAHMIDIGGIAAGSFMTNAKELIQEGIIIPPVRLYSRGHLNHAVEAILGRNIRQPVETLGDLHSLVAATRIGAQRLQELATELGTPRLLSAMTDLIDYAEERGRRELSALGDSEAEFTDYLDNDGVTGEPVRYHIKLALRDGKVTADFTGSNPQVKAGINSTLSTTRSVLQWCLRTQMTEDYPDNAGFYRLLTIHSTPGTIVNSNNDAPVASRGLTAFRLVDCIFGAMAKMFPGRIWAAGDGSFDPLTIGGLRDDGSRFTMVEPVGGTTGARPTADGIEGVAPPIGNSRNTSIEVLERAFPVRILAYGSACGTGGQGTYRGGNAITRSYELLCDKAEVVIRSDRKRHAPWGLAGGLPGTPSKSVLVTADGKEIELPSRHVFEMLRGQRLIWRGASGGGYGPVAARDVKLVERDRREGRIE